MALLHCLSFPSTLVYCFIILRIYQHWLFAWIFYQLRFTVLNTLLTWVNRVITLSALFHCLVNGHIISLLHCLRILFALAHCLNILSALLHSASILNIKKVRKRLFTTQASEKTENNMNLRNEKESSSTHERRTWGCDPVACTSSEFFRSPDRAKWGDARLRIFRIFLRSFPSNFDFLLLLLQLRLQIRLMQKNVEYAA